MAEQAKNKKALQRCYQNTMTVSGVAIVVFGVWDAVKLWMLWSFDGGELVCLFSLQSEKLVADFYAVGLIVSACVRVASAFRRTAIAYIP